MGQGDIQAIPIPFILITQLQCNECSFYIIKTTEVPGEAVLSTYMQKNRSAAEALLPDPNVGA